MEYGPEVLRLFAAPSRCGELPVSAPGAVTGEAEDRALQVWVRFQLQVTGGVVQAVRYRTFGCPHTVAAAEWVAGRLEGRPVVAMGELDMASVGRALAVPAEKLGKLLRIEDALAACRRTLDARTELDDGDITDQ